MGVPSDHTSTGQGQEGTQPTAEPAAAQGATDAELARLEDRWRRAVADLDNLRKRYARELERERSAERLRVAAAFLPVVDNLERALGHAGSDTEAVISGVRAVLDQALQVLSQLGYPRDTEVDVPFDPRRHEVISVTHEAADRAPGTVVEVLRPGYGTGSTQLRPATVVVTAQQE